VNGSSRDQQGVSDDHMQRNTPPRALILGGGLAGLAACVRLREVGCHITLVEAKNRLGGRATSFDDPQTGITVDNCQHILLRCCTNLIDFYHRLGVLQHITWHDSFYFASCHPDGTRNTTHIDTLKRNLLLPAPFHLALSFLKFRALSIPDKLALARGVRALISAKREDLENISFYDFLRQNEQPDQLINRFWEVIIISACNGSVRRVSASYAAQVFQTGFLNHAKAFIMGIPSGPLRELYDPALSLIDDLRLGKRVNAVNINNDNGESPKVVSVTLHDGCVLDDFDIVVVALPAERIPSLFANTQKAVDLSFTRAVRLETSPILSIHLWFDRSITQLPHTAFLDHDIQWVFFKEEGRYAHIVISAADDWVSISQQDILLRVLGDLRTAFPEATLSNVKSSRVIKEKHATFLPAPGCDALRPGNTTAIANMFLAGDYTQSGWPATMEGAVRSGYLASRAAVLYMNENNLAQRTSPSPLIVPDLVPDLPSSLLYRVLRDIPVI